MSVNLENGYELIPVRTAREQTEAVILRLAGPQVGLVLPPLIFMSRAEAVALIGKIRTVLDTDGNLRSVARAIMRLDGYSGTVAEAASINSGPELNPLQSIDAVMESEVSQVEHECTITLTLLRHIETGAPPNTRSLLIKSEPAVLAWFSLNLRQALYPTFEAEIVDLLANP